MLTTTLTTITQTDSIADHYRFALDLLSNGVDLEPYKIAEILTLQAAAILADLGDLDNSEALAAIAHQLNPAAYQ